MDQEVESAAARVLTGEASPNEKAALDALLAEDPQARREFAELGQLAETLKVAGPLTRLADQTPELPPAQHLSSLKESLERKFQPDIQAPRYKSKAFNRARASGPLPAFKRWAPSCAIAFAVVVAIAAIWLPRGRRDLPPIASSAPRAYVLLDRGTARLDGAEKQIGPGESVALWDNDQVRLGDNTLATVITRNGTSRLMGSARFVVGDLIPMAANRSESETTLQEQNVQTALFQSAAELENCDPLVPTRASRGIPIYSPLGATARLNPVILWKVEPGRRYDLAIHDDLDGTAPSWKVQGLTNPVPFAQAFGASGRFLAPDRLYRLSLTFSDEPLSASSYTFRTTEDASPQTEQSQSAQVFEAYRVLSDGSGRVGDALANLLTLPEATGNSELVLRLKALAFAQAGYRRDFDTVLWKLNAGQAKLEAGHPRPSNRSISRGKTVQ